MCDYHLIDLLVLISSAHISACQCILHEFITLRRSWISSGASSCACVAEKKQKKLFRQIRQRPIKNYMIYMTCKSS